MKHRAEKIREQNMLQKNRLTTVKSSANPLREGDENVKLRAVTDEQTEEKKRMPIKRFSPFLMLVCVLLILFPYMMITGNGNIKSFWLLLFLFPFTVTNVFFADIAIWKYFSGKKVIPIWLIELTLSILIVQLLI